MPLAQTYLLLSPEFGGTKFGPFKGMEIRLGSDSGRNDIELPEALGVLPEHVKLLKQGDDTFIVAPTERSAGVFIWRAGHQRAKQITSPMAIQAGSDSYSADAFSLVTPEGPKFYIIQEIPQQDATGPETGLDRAKKRVSSKSLLAEIKRQGLTSVLTTRVGQQFQRWLTFIRTGAILHPRNIVTGALGLVGWVFAGGAACTMFSLASDRSVAQEELGECNSNMQMINMMNDNPTSADNITTIMARILNDQNWADAFESDDILFGAVKKKVKKILSSNRRGDYEWVYKKGNNFRKFRTGLQQQGMNQKLMAVVPYLAALPGNADTERDWNLNPKSADGQEECGRGPLNMTWRQAYNLGFTEEELQYDATVPENDYSDDRDILTDLLRQSAGSLGGIDSDSIDFGSSEINNAIAVDGVLCIYIEGPDKRSFLDEVGTPTGLAKAVSGALAKGGGLPSESSPGGAYTLNRLAKFFAADMTRGFRKIDLSSTDGVDGIMDPAKNADASAFVMDNVAEVISRALTIPCLAALDKRADPEKTTTMIGPLPEIVDCLMLTGMAEYDLF